MMVTKVVSEKVASNLGKWRYYSVLGVLSVFMLIILGRLFQLHVLDADFLLSQGDARTLRSETLVAHRGMLTDRYGEPLAVSTPVTTLWADPRVVPEEDISRLALALDVAPSALQKKFSTHSHKAFMYLKRHMVPSRADAVLGLNIKGVHGQNEYRRYYPAAEVTAQLLGFTDIDDKGQEGIELAYDKWLKGIPGKRRFLKDRRGRVVKDLGVVESAKSGNDLALTLDLRIQYLAYRELKAAVKAHKANSGTIVVLDVKTGGVLAVVNSPSFNPNARRSQALKYMRNRAITDQFEPGSTVKPLTVAAALESGHYTAESMINTSPGHLRIQGKTIRDHRNYGEINLKTIITKSSNVGVSKIALELEPEYIRDTFFNFGFGQDTGTAFPGEGFGLLPSKPKWRRVERATLSYGYGLSVTAMQLSQAYLTLATNGIRRPISLIAKDQYDDGPRVISEKNARDVIKMLETVVHTRGGTGSRAGVKGYRVGGKTGTVHKVGPNGYQDDKYRSLFAGLAPINDPQIVAVVVIDSPKGREYYGGEVAAPIFSRVVGGALRLLNIAPDDLPGPTVSKSSDSLGKNSHISSENFSMRSSTHNTSVHSLQLATKEVAF